MAVVNRNPWGDQQDSFENLTQKAAKPVVKVVGDTVKAVAADIKQQVTGDYPTSPEATLGAGGSGQSQKAQDAAQQKQQLLLQTRQNLEKINQDIKKIRQERAKKIQEVQKVNERQKEQKKFEEKKKQEEPFWRKLLKGKTGSKEGNVRAAG
jgi:hypothetical protein